MFLGSLPLGRTSNGPHHFPSWTRPSCPCPDTHSRNAKLLCWQARLKPHGDAVAWPQLSGPHKTKADRRARPMMPSDKKGTAQTNNPPLGSWRAGVSASCVIDPRPWTGARARLAPFPPIPAAGWDPVVIFVEMGWGAAAVARAAESPLANRSDPPGSHNEDYTTVESK